MKANQMTTILAAIWMVGAVASDTGAEWFFCVFSAAAFVGLTIFALWRDAN